MTDQGENRLESSRLEKPFWTRHLLREVQFLLDLSILAGAFAVAYLLRFEFQIPPDELRNAVVQLPAAVLLQFTILALLGVYSFIWRYVGMAEIRSFLLAAGFSMLPLLLMRFGLPDSLAYLRIPLSVIFMDTVFGFGGVLGIRVLRRALYERFEREGPSGLESISEKRRILLIGAGQAGLMAVKELDRQGRRDLEIVGFVDDDSRKVGAVIQGVRVLGDTASLAPLVEEHRIDEVVITMVKADRSTISRLIDSCRKVGVEFRIMPAFHEILEGRVDVGRFRKVRIEDLLGRDPVHLDEVSMRRFLSGRKIMVTGAGGSIGSELARQIARFSPKSLILVERAEPALFQIARELTQLWGPSMSIAVVADVSNENRMKSILDQHRPEIVLHAAAHKHVPLMESNAIEALRNNAWASHRLGQWCGEIGVQRFILISTDKAVNPSSVMGASKRLAEILIQDLEGRYPTTYLAVRFGNVLGSTGSVIPIFQEQIEKGGPLTVTHPEMERYFMTIPEASQLVLQAAALGQGGAIFVLDMGEPVHIVDLAKDMIRLAGLEPDRDIEIVFSGLRPGEKLREELGLLSENLEKTTHPKIFVGAIQPYPSEEVHRIIRALKVLVGQGDSASIHEALARWIPEASLSTQDQRIG